MKKSDTPHKDGLFQQRLSLFYSAIFLSIGCYMPYFPLWLSASGLSEQEMAIILAAPMIVRVMCAPLISLWADHSGNYRAILNRLALGSFTALIGFSYVQGFYPILLVASINAIFWSAIIPLTETMAMQGARRARINYGQARSWGSASFIVGSVATGLVVERLGASSILGFLIVAGGLIMLAALILPQPTGEGRLRAAVAKGRFAWPSVGILIKNPVFWLFLVVAGLGQASHAFYYGFASLHWQSLGIEGGVIGALWALGVIAEIALFVLAGQKLQQVNPASLLVLASGVTLVRWAAMTMEPALWVLVLLQLLHAFSFGLAHLGAMYFLAKAVPENLSATAQGLNATLSAGVLMGGLISLSGPLYAHFGAGGYGVMAGVAGLAFILGLVLLNAWDRKPLFETERKPPSGNTPSEPHTRETHIS